MAERPAILDTQFIAQVVLNQRKSAEGSVLPPPQKGEFRVPFVRGLKVEKRSSFLGGTQFTLTWLAPDTEAQISHYNVYVLGLLDQIQTPQGPTTVKKSPAVVRLVSDTKSRIIFKVQTVLASGMTSDLDASPAVGSEMLTTGAVAATDLNGIGTTGEVLTWLAGTATLIGPGAANEILTGNGAASVPVFRSRTTLDLVEGRSALTTANRLVLVASSGVVTQLGSLGTTTTVLHGNAAGAPSFGAVSLTADVSGTLPVGNGGTGATSFTAGSVVFSNGTILTQDNANLFWDDTSNFLGVGNGAPAARLHVTEATLGAEVLRLTSTATNDDPAERVFQNRAATTDATVTTLHTVAIPATTTVALEAMVVARRTGGAAGTAEDGARYQLSAVYKNVAGTATLIGVVTKVADEDQAGWDANFTPSSGNVLVEVTGAVDNNVTWHLTLRYYAVST